MTGEAPTWRKLAILGAITSIAMGVCLLGLLYMSRGARAELRRQIESADSLLKLEANNKATDDSLRREIAVLRRDIPGLRNSSARHRAARDSLQGVLDSLWAVPVEGGAPADSGTACAGRLEQMTSGYRIRTRQYMEASAELVSMGQERDRWQEIASMEQDRTDFQNRRANDLAEGLAALADAARPRRILGIELTPTVYFVSGVVIGTATSLSISRLAGSTR